MRLTPDLERTLRRYLLGDLEEGARIELEEQLVVDPEVFEALGVVEDELAENYLDGALSGDERTRFERHLRACPTHRQGLGFARALRRRASTLGPGEAATLAASPAAARPVGRGWRDRWAGAIRPSRWQPAWVAVAAALMLSLAANVWLASRRPTPSDRRLADGPAPSTVVRAPTPSPQAVASPLAPGAAVATDRLAELAAENRDLRAALEGERQQRARAEARGLDAGTARPRSVVPTFALAAGLLRGAGTLARLRVPADAGIVRLELEPPADEYPAYRAVLRDPDGDEIWAVSKLRAEATGDQPAIVLMVPAAMLPHGDYRLELSGVAADGEREALASYPFRVMRE